MPKLEYPSTFSGGLVGIRCKEDIGHREAALFVPLKITMTLKKALTHPVLSKIVKENPQAFSEIPGNCDPDQICPNSMTLILFIIFEMTLGEKSFWYPYLMYIQKCRPTCFWNKDLLKEM